MAPKVLITGVTGYLGSRIALKFLEKGYEVIGTSRSRSKLDYIHALLMEHVPVHRLQMVETDISTTTDIYSLSKGISGIIHVASPVPTKHTGNKSSVINDAVNTTLGILEAAIANDIPKVVYTSSLVSIGYGHKLQPEYFDESNWTRLDNKGDLNDYIVSKTLAESEAWQYIKTSSSNVKFTSINPGFVLGPPIDPMSGSSLLLIKRLLTGSVPGIPNIGISLVDIRDVAELHLLAFESDKANGQRFICTSNYMLIEEIIDYLRAQFPHFSHKLPRYKFPDFLVRFLALFNSEIRGVIYELNKHRKFDNKKARKLLSFRPRSCFETLKDTVTSLEKFGMI